MVGRARVVKAGANDFLRNLIDRDKAMSRIEGFVGFGKNETVLRFAGENGRMVVGFIPVIGRVMNQPGDFDFLSRIHGANDDHDGRLTLIGAKWELLRHSVRA